MKLSKYGPGIPFTLSYEQRIFNVSCIIWKAANILESAGRLVFFTTRIFKPKFANCTAIP